ncbi:hypothetical protein [Spirosoma sp.]|uniref:hypothetical protein n=1 Tax=Spirosoma sp. TaxID=1899569 RepID=UPI0026388BE8|nr:hypothetical protein [Spirosoma sp.]MCX6219079.1 hypothetical protein [Spirosoma sp.]
MRIQKKHDADDRHRAQAHSVSSKGKDPLVAPLGLLPPVQRLITKQPASKDKFSGRDMASTFQFKMAVIQQQPKPVVTGTSKDSAKLKNIVNALFKAAPVGGAAIGDGSALAACTHEKNGGAKVGGADHQIKCTDVLNGINKLITRSKNAKVMRSGSQLSAEDLIIATKLKADLSAALDGTYTG